MVWWMVIYHVSVLSDFNFCYWIVVMDHDDFSKDDVIGGVKLPLTECVGKEKAPKLRMLLGSDSEVSTIINFAHVWYAVR